MWRSTNTKLSKDCLCAFSRTRRSWTGFPRRCLTGFAAGGFSQDGPADGRHGRIGDDARQGSGDSERQTSALSLELAGAPFHPAKRPIADPAAIP